MPRLVGTLKLSSATEKRFHGLLSNEKAYLPVMAYMYNG